MITPFKIYMDQGCKTVCPSGYIKIPSMFRQGSYLSRKSWFFLSFWLLMNQVRHRCSPGIFFNLHFSERVFPDHMLWCKHNVSRGFKSVASLDIRLVAYFSASLPSPKVASRMHISICMKWSDFPTWCLCIFERDLITGYAHIAKSV